MFKKWILYKHIEMITENLKDWEIVTDDKVNTWLYLYWVFSSYEPNKQERINIFERWLKENIRNLYNIAILLNEN